MPLHQRWIEVFFELASTGPDAKRHGDTVTLIGRLRRLTSAAEECAENLTSQDSLDCSPEGLLDPICVGHGLSAGAQASDPGSHRTSPGEADNQNHGTNRTMRASQTATTAETHVVLLKRSGVVCGVTAACCSGVISIACRLLTGGCDLLIQEYFCAFASLADWIRDLSSCRPFASSEHARM